MIKWHIYRLTSPIDFGWENLQTAEQAFAKIATQPDEWSYDHLVPSQLGFPNPGSSLEEAKEFLVDLQKVRDLAAEHVRWEGDVRGRMYVFWMPAAEATFNYGFVRKHDNNGDTFIAAPSKIVFDPKVFEPDSDNYFAVP